MFGAISFGSHDGPTPFIPNFPSLSKTLQAGITHIPTLSSTLARGRNAKKVCVCVRRGVKKKEKVPISVFSLPIYIYINAHKQAAAAAAETS